MALTPKEINDLLKSTREQKFRKQSQSKIDATNLIKIIAIENAKNPEWIRKNKEGQERRKLTNWSSKMIGNKNGINSPRNKGMKNSPESNVKRSEALKGIERHNLRGVPKPKLTCPHCGKEGGKPQMIQYHFDKCKLKQ